MSSVGEDGQKVRGYRFAYKLSHGLPVEFRNVSMKAQTYDRSYEGQAMFDWDMVVAFGDSPEKCFRVLIETVTQMVV